MPGLVKQLEADLGHKDINVVIGRFSPANNGSPGWDAIRKIQEDVCKLRGETRARIALEPN